MRKISIKKIISKLLVIASVLLLGVGCQKLIRNDAPKDNKKLNVTVTTSFVYDMVQELSKDSVVKDQITVDLIIPHGEDPHLYVAKPEDLKKIQEADLLIYHGLHFEGKMNDVLSKKGIAISSTFDSKKIGSMEEDGKDIIDPHFWFNIGLYKEASKNTADALIKLLPDHSKEIDKNLEDYLKNLDELDLYIKEKLDQVPKDKRYLITPHDAFNYFSKSYDIQVVAPQGVSTESEVSNADIEKTANFIVGHKVKAIFSESTTNPERMKKLQEVCKSKGFDVKVISGEGKELFSDSLAPKGQVGDTYIDMYKHNVDLIVDNLK